MFKVIPDFERSLPPFFTLQDEQAVQRKEPDDPGDHVSPKEEEDRGEEEEEDRGGEDDHAHPEDEQTHSGGSREDQGQTPVCRIPLLGEDREGLHEASVGTAVWTIRADQVERRTESGPLRVGEDHP